MGILSENSNENKNKKDQNALNMFFKKMQKADDKDKINTNILKKFDIQN